MERPETTIAAVQNADRTEIVISNHPMHLSLLCFFIFGLSSSCCWSHCVPMPQTMDQLASISFPSSSSSPPNPVGRASGWRCTSNCLALIGIQSVSNHTDRRMRMRQTWLRPPYRTQGVDHVFVLAMQDLSPKQVLLLRCVLKRAQYLPIIRFYWVMGLKEMSQLLGVQLFASCALSVVVSGLSMGSM